MYKGALTKRAVDVLSFSPMRLWFNSYTFLMSFILITSITRYKKKVYDISSSDTLRQSSDVKNS